MAGKRRSYGDGSVFYRHPANGRKGYWMARLYVTDAVTGKTKRLERSASSRDEARIKLEEMKGQQSMPAPTPLTVADWFAQWIEVNLPRLQLAPNTRDNYSNVLRYYAIPAAGKVMLADFNPSAAEAWIGRVAATMKRNGKPVSDSTVRNTFAAASRSLDTAVRDGLIASNPLRSIDRPKKTRKDVPVRTEDEFDRLLVECEGYRIHPLVVFVGLTGCRIGEALSLHWKDVDLENATATIKKGSHERDSTKGGRWITVTLIPEVVEALRFVKTRTARERLAMGEGWKDTGLVFVTSTGNPCIPRNTRRDLQERLKAAGITTARPWHSDRHGFATRLLKRGVPLEVVSKMIGHSSLAITADIYGHIDSRVPVEILEEALRRKR